MKCPECGKDIDDKKIASYLGSRGGRKTKKVHGNVHFEEISAKGIAKRRKIKAKNRKATER